MYVTSQSELYLVQNSMSCISTWAAILDCWVVHLCYTDGATDQHCTRLSQIFSSTAGGNGYIGSASFVSLYGWCYTVNSWYQISNEKLVWDYSSTVGLPAHCLIS